FHDSAPLAIYTLSLHDALPISFFAVSLIKRTKYNVSWILISISFSFMAVQRVYDLILIFHSNQVLEQTSIVSSWLSVVISLLILDRKSTRLNSSHVKISYAGLF